MSLSAANIVVVPVPYLSSNGFTNRAQNTKRAQIVLFNVLCAGSLEETQSSGCNIKLVHLVLVDDVPVSRIVGISWGSLEDNCSRTTQ